jgi:butyryl-CoA dehydrogenase
MGFIEETGAAQYYRDARIITIYEGTTGIQANDLLGRKTARDRGETARAIAADIDKVAAKLASHADPALRPVGLRLAAATASLQNAIDWVVATFDSKVRVAHAAAVPYLRLWGLAAGGWQMGRAALIAAEKLASGSGDARFLRAKIATARFYAENLLPQAEALEQSITEGSDSALALAAEQF